MFLRSVFIVKLGAACAQLISSVFSSGFLLNLDVTYNSALYFLTSKICYNEILHSSVHAPQNFSLSKKVAVVSETWITRLPTLMKSPAISAASYFEKMWHVSWAMCGWARGGGDARLITGRGKTVRIKLPSFSAHPHTVSFGTACILDVRGPL